MPNPFQDDGISDADIELWLEESEEVFQGKIDLAEKAAEYGRQISPVGDPATDPHSGRYRASIKVTVEGHDVFVGSDDLIANIIEYGTVDTPEFAVFAQVQAKYGLYEP